MKSSKISAFLFAAIVAVGVFAVLGVCMARADARPSTRDMDLYLLIGQSNMAGRGALTEANRVSTERVFKLDKSGNWEDATEPIHFDKTSAGAGLAASFARTRADRDPSVKIGLVPCAVGGSHMKTWVKGGVNYSNAVVRLRKALESGVLKGILWHQGEGDATDAAETAAWAEKFAGMIADLRSEFGDVPVVGYRQLAPLATDQDGLGVCQGGGSRGAVSHVSDSCEAL